MIYVGSLASFSFFFFSPETTPRETLPEKKKKLTERDQVLSEKKEFRERGGRILPVFPSEDFSSSSDLFCILSYPSSPAYTRTLFLNKASVKHLVTRRFKHIESSDCQTALFLLSYSIRRPCDHSGMMKRNRRIEDKPWSCLLILQPFLLYFWNILIKRRKWIPLGRVRMICGKYIRRWKWVFKT